MTEYMQSAEANPSATISIAPHPLLHTAESMTFAPNSMTKERLETYLSPSSENVGWTTAGAIVRGEAPIYCVDGREHERVVGVPGGDAYGVIAGLLMSAEHAAARDAEGLDQDEVTAVVDWYAKQYGKVYLHTDSHAMEHLGHEIAKHDAFTGILDFDPQDTKKLEEYLRSRPDDDKQEEALLNLLADPNNFGCGHGRNMVLTPDEYAMDKRIMSQITEAFMKGLWDGKKGYELEVLEGNHEEQAVVEIVHEGELSDDTPIPMIRPSDDTRSIFVWHHDFIRWFSKQAADELVGKQLVRGLENTDDSMQRMEQALEEHLDNAALTTTQKLAPTLPIYQVRVE